MSQNRGKLRPVDRTERVDLDAYAEELAERNRRGDCFICDLVGDPAGAHVVFKDDVAIGFLPRHLTMPGRVLVAPLDHRTEVVGDFSVADYLELQKRIHTIGTAVAEAFPTERLYIFSFGAKEGVDHVHWHIAGLPPGVPFREQQHHAVMLENGRLALTEEEMTAIAARIRVKLASPTR